MRVKDTHTFFYPSLSIVRGSQEFLILGNMTGRERAYGKATDMIEDGKGGDIEETLKDSNTKTFSCLEDKKK